MHSKSVRQIGIVLEAILVVSAFAITDAQAQTPNQPDMPRDYAALVRPKLPAGWRCTYDFDTLVISRDEEVALLGRMNVPPARTHDELIQKYSVRSPYLIVLTFMPRLSDAEHRQQLAQRDAALAAVRAKYSDPRLGKEAYGAEGLEAAKHRVPGYYNHRFSIHLHATTDELSGNLYLAAPETAIKEREAVMRLLLENMTAYPSPQTGTKSN